MNIPVNSELIAEEEPESFGLGRTFKIQTEAKGFQYEKAPNLT